MNCEHEFINLLAKNKEEMVRTPLMACKHCGALKTGKGTITITSDYIQFPLLTTDPAGAEGRMT